VITLKKIVLILASIFLTSRVAFAEILIVFDNPHLIATTSAKGIVGYFNTLHQVLDSSCRFLFKETDRSTDTKIDIISFPLPSNGFEKRNRADDISGSIFRTKNDWIIQTAEPQDGCGGAVGSFNKGPDDDYPTRHRIIKKLPVIGVRLVLKKTRINDKNGQSFKERRRFLAAGDVVVAIETKKNLTSIRYVHPATGNIILGWVQTSDLMSPFVEKRINPSTERFSKLKTGQLTK
jgi:hypothetical protein